MAKRRTTRQEKTAAKRKTAKQKTTNLKEDARWHICDHCIGPLIDSFFEIVHPWCKRRSENAARIGADSPA